MNEVAELIMIILEKSFNTHAHKAREALREWNPFYLTNMEIPKWKAGF